MTNEMVTVTRKRGGIVELKLWHTDKGNVAASWWAAIHASVSAVEWKNDQDTARRFIV